MLFTTNDFYSIEICAKVTKGELCLSLVYTTLQLMLWYSKSIVLLPHLVLKDKSGDILSPLSNEHSEPTKYI